VADLEIDFECKVAAKYAITPATAGEISQYRANPGFDSFPGSGSLRDIPENQWPLYLGHIVPIGKTKRQRVSTEKLGSVVRTLVAGLEGKTEPFHVIVLKIVHELGEVIVSNTLVTLPDEGNLHDQPFMWRRLAEKLRLMFEGRRFDADNQEVKWPHPAAQIVGDLGIFLIPDKDNKPVLAVRPYDLFDALTLVAARMIATGTTTFICENCKTPFLSGGSRGRNKRRGDARFCSDRCRYEFHNRRKAR
jgi:hypothetical protein